jgi:hypothetical protein
MHWILIIAIIVVLFILIIWICRSLHKNGKLPDGVFKQSYEVLVNNANRTYDKYFTDPLSLYQKTVGYEYDDGVKLAIEKSLKKDQ